jgi:hypothetical protein
MPVDRFKSVTDMPGLVRFDGPDLIDRIRALWNRAFALSPPDFPRGISRFTCIEDANQARYDHLVARMRRTASHARPHTEDGGRAAGKRAATELTPMKPPASDGGPDGGTSSVG